MPVICVNGVEREMTPKEVVEYQEWVSALPAPPKRTIPKSVVSARLIAAGLIAPAMAALQSDPVAFARWISADKPVVDCDDPLALQLLKAIGANPDEILAP